MQKSRIWLKLRVLSRLWSLNIPLILSTQLFVLPCRRILSFLNFKAYFTNDWINTRHVCTYLNVFLVISNGTNNSQFTPVINLTDSFILYKVLYWILKIWLCWKIPPNKILANKKLGLISWFDCILNFSTI